MSTPVLKTDKKAKERAYEMLTVYGKGKEQIEVWLALNGHNRPTQEMYYTLIQSKITKA